MPVLSKSNRPTKKIVLFGKGKDEAWVEVHQEMLMGEVMEMSKYKDNPESASPDVLCKLIKAWNFTDDNQKPLEITPENVSLLPIVYIAKIMEEAEAFDSLRKLQTAQKKSSSSTLVPSTTEVPEKK